MGRQKIEKIFVFLKLIRKQYLDYLKKKFFDNSEEDRKYRRKQRKFMRLISIEKILKDVIN